MPFEVSVSDVHSFPGIGWDTRPRYSSRTLVVRALQVLA